MNRSSIKRRNQDLVLGQGASLRDDQSHRLAARSGFENIRHAITQHGGRPLDEDKAQPTNRGFFDSREGMAFPGNDQVSNGFHDALYLTHFVPASPSRNLALLASVNFSQS